MQNNRNVVVIPFYRAHPSYDEIGSLRQCAEILRKYCFYLVCPQGLQVDEYSLILNQYHCQYKIEYFDPTFFKSVSGYNQLMLYAEFYKRFSNHDYMLIYQLDAWVFRDELDFWCQQGYDYIGAPWLEPDKNGILKFAGVGNGGFSLRRVQHFIEVLSHKGPVRTADQLNLPPTIKNRIYKFLYSLGYQNTISYYKKDPTLFEDIFLSIFLSNTKLCAKMPSPEEAGFFAFEEYPSLLFSKNGQLPFGCHAWRKYEYETFWHQFVNPAK